MPFIAQCKICRSEHRELIDSLLASSTPYREIIKWAAEKSFKICLKNLSVHNNAHRIPNLGELTFNPDKKEKVTKPVKCDPETRAKAEEFLREHQLLSESDFLRLIIQKATVDILNDRLHPSVNDANKSAELLQKIKDGDPMQGALLSALKEIASNHALIVPSVN
jgi:hypothetical protein